MSDISKGTDPRQQGDPPPGSENQEVHLYSEADDAFLFAAARNPARYDTLSEAEGHSIDAWVRGTASAAEIDLARMAVRKNRAAKELLLSLQLEKAALTSPPVPQDVSDRILGLVVPKSTWSVRRLLTFRSLPRWQYAGLGAAAAAALVLMIILNQPIGPSSASFQVATLSDRSVLGQEGGSVTRGLPTEAPADRPTETSGVAQEFVEVDVPKVTLQGLFGVSEPTRKRRSHAALVKAINLVLRSEEKNPPSLIFDSEIETSIKAGIDSELVTLRVYDLTASSNAILVSNLAVVPGVKSVFITLAP